MISVIRIIFYTFSFKEICERAYLIIRSRAHLLIQLFTMMLSSGIPQLNNVSDIDYIKEVLALNSTQEEALEKFRKKFKEAQDNSWSTTVNWWFHMRVHWKQLPHKECDWIAIFLFQPHFEVYCWFTNQICVHTKSGD